MQCSHHFMFSSLLRSSKPCHFFSSSHLRCLSSSPASSLARTSQSAEEYLRSLLRAGENPTTSFDGERAIVSALKSCASLSAASHGRQIHSLALKSGLESNTFISNSLISMYAKCKLVSEARSLFDSSPSLDVVSFNIMLSGYVKSWEIGNARKMFDETPHRGCIAYTTMIIGLSRSGSWDEAVELFKAMRSDNIVPNEVTMAGLISACVHTGGVSDCQMLHSLLIKLQLLRSVFVSTNLLNMYCNCSKLGEARKLFDEMSEERNIVSWNVMLNGYSKAGLVDLARDLFEIVPAKDVVSWGTMIDGYVQVERLSDALMMCRSMLRTGLRANDIMIVDLVSACGRFTAVLEGMQLHGMIVKEGLDRLNSIQATIIGFYSSCGFPNLARIQFESGEKNHLASLNALIAGYMKNNMIDEARKMFDAMLERDVFSWSAVISGYAQNDQPDVALRLFHEMRESGIEANEVTMVSVLSSIASLGVLAEGKRAHEYIKSKSIPLSDNLIAGIIDMYAKCGTVNVAVEMFDKIRDKVLTISPWNAIICGLATHGYGNLALEIFSDLQKRLVKVKVNGITFIGVLSACCHAGLVSLGEEYFKSMRSVYNVEPDVRHYGCMVDLLGRAGRLDEAERLITRMPMEADVVIWGALLAACRKHGNVEIGERAAENLTRLEPSHGPGRLLMSNIYAEAGRWEEAFSIRRDMRVLGMKRSPGCSGFV